MDLKNISFNKRRHIKEHILCDPIYVNFERQNESVMLNQNGGYMWQGGQTCGHITVYICENLLSYTFEICAFCGM